MELVVADNANVDETAAVLEHFKADPRLKIVRSDVLLDVTDSWNLALAASAGDYLLLIGDDDLLLPRYFETVDGLLVRHGDPDCLTYNAYSFVAARAVSGDTRSYYRETHFKFGREYIDETPLPKSLRRSIVRDLYAFNQRFPMNMQMTVISRRAVESLSDGLFRSPFPDHYGLSALLLRADRWLYSSTKPIVVGVSAKSFGHFFHSDDPSGGLGYLGVSPRFDGRLPGNEVLNAICVWLLDLKRDYPEELRDVEIRWPTYLLRQAYAWAREYSAGLLPRTDLVARVRSISLREWLSVLVAPLDTANLRDLRRILETRLKGSHPLLREFEPLPGVANMTEFGDWITSTTKRWSSNDS